MISLSLEREHQKEKHSAPTHIIVVLMTGNVRGWEISVIVFTSSWTVAVGPSATRFHTKSPTLASSNAQAFTLSKDWFTHTVSSVQSISNEVCGLLKLTNGIVSG